MTKDEARDQAVYEYKPHSFLSAEASAALQDGFDAGYDAAMSRTCEWTVTDAHAYGTVYRASCKPDTDLQDVEFDDGEEPATVFPKFCPNCGGKIVPPNIGEEKNDD